MRLTSTFRILDELIGEDYSNYLEESHILEATFKAKDNLSLLHLDCYNEVGKSRIGSVDYYHVDFLGDRPISHIKRITNQCD